MPARTTLTSEQQEIAERLVKSGVGPDSIRGRLNIGLGTARRLVAELRAKHGISPNPKFHGGETLESLEQEISLNYERAVRAASKLRLSADRTIRWSPPNPSKPCAIAFLADVHAGCEGTDYEALDRDVELILNTDGMYCVLVGDLIDNHIKHLAAMVAAKMTPGDQWRWLARMLVKLSPKIIAVVGGNHEAWTVALTGFDPLRSLSDRLITQYRSHTALIRVAMSGAEYLICARHKARFNSSLNPTHAVKRLWEFGPADWDVGVVAHNHEGEVNDFCRHGRQRWALRPGTYQVRSEYADAAGYFSSAPATPAVVLRADAKRANGFPTLDWAANSLDGFRYAESAKRGGK